MNFNSKDQINNKKVLIKGSYGLGNFGDDALMVVCYNLLKNIFKPENIIFECFEATYVHRLITGIKIVSQINNKCNFDLLVYGGGTQFYSFPLTGAKTILHQFNCIARCLSSTRKVINYLKKRFTEKGNFKYTAAIGIGIGPFVPNSIQKIRAKKLFTKMDFISVRDSSSFLTCNSWGINTVNLGTDLCFLPGLWNIAYPSAKHIHPDTKKVGIIVRDWPHTKAGAAYKEPILHVAKRLRTTGHQVTFISFCHDADKEWFEVFKKEKETILCYYPESADINTFLYALNEFNCFITARYHGAVFGAILAKPIICIEVEEKLRLVADLFGSGACLWKQPFKIEDCLFLVDKVFNNYWQNVESIQKVVLKQKELANLMSDEFLNFVKRVLFKRALK